MVTVPPDLGALGVLAAALSWALYELRSWRTHTQDVHEERLETRQELEEKKLRVLEQQARAHRLQGKALASIADHLDGGLDVDDELEQRPPS